MHDADFPKIPRVKLEKIDLYRLSPVHIEMSKTNQLKKSTCSRGMVVL